MQPKCIAAVQAAAKAAGRAKPLTEGQINDIDSRLKRTMRELAKSDPDWQSLSTDQRIMAASDKAMQDIAAESQRKVVNAQLQIVKTAATEGRIQEAMREYNTSRSKALVHDMENIEKSLLGLKNREFARMMNMMDAISSTDGTSIGRRVSMLLFDAENPAMTRDLAREIFNNADGSTGNKAAQEGAKAYLAVAEDLRKRMNNAGGNVGKLQEGYIPTKHSARLVRGDNSIAARDTWVSKLLPRLNRDRYRLENGALMGDQELTSVLNGMWETIKSEGLNKMVPGEFKGEGARANHGSQHREIHFKSADATLDYLSEYGNGTMLDSISQHIGSIGKDITLMEAYGPNPSAQMRLQFHHAVKADGKLERLGFGVGIARVDAEGVWKTLSGAASVPDSEVAAMVGQHARNIQALKLAGTFLKSFPDIATFFRTTGYNKLSYWEAIQNIGRVAGSSETRQWAAMHGLMAESQMRSFNRFADENIRHSWSGRVSNSQMRLSFLDAWTNGLTMAFGITKMGAMGRLARTEWASIPQWDRIHLERGGLSEADWSVVRIAKLPERNGIPMLSPDAIIQTGHPNAYQIADRVLGIIKDESSTAVIQSDLLTRTAATWNGMQAGTGVGEFARATMQFKSFPAAMINRHWRRMINMPHVTDGSAPAMLGGRYAEMGMGPVTVNRMLYMGGLIVTTTALGALSLQASTVAQGKDPIDMTGKHAGKFWLQAMSIGGGLGFYGDLITRDTTSDRSAWDTVGRTFGGPLGGDLVDLWALTKGNIDQASAGKTTHAAAETVNLARSHLPYINLWYAKAALDHAGMHALQENLSPGYLSKMKERAKKDFGQDYFWAPGTGLPDRGPDIAKSVGK